MKTDNDQKRQRANNSLNINQSVRRTNLSIQALPQNVQNLNNSVDLKKFSMNGPNSANPQIINQNYSYDMKKNDNIFLDQGKRVFGY